MAKEAKEVSVDNNASLQDLQLQGLKIATEIRNLRIRRILVILARTKNKSFNIKRYEANLNDAIKSHLNYHIDDALDVLEILLDVE